ncbi:MAG: hypothetical protein R3B54_09675 [Bdellovibrionota bacterium]
MRTASPLGGRRIDAGTVFWAVGGSRQLNCHGPWRGDGSLGTRQGGSDLSLVGDPSVFVVGDAAYVVDKSGKPLPAVAPAAKQQGQHVGRVLKARLAGKFLLLFNTSIKEV